MNLLNYFGASKMRFVIRGEKKIKKLIKLRKLKKN